jgi:hypothetical protein
MGDQQQGQQPKIKLKLNLGGLAPKAADLSTERPGPAPAHQKLKLKFPGQPTPFQQGCPPATAKQTNSNKKAAIQTTGNKKPAANQPVTSKGIKNVAQKKRKPANANEVSLSKKIKLFPTASGATKIKLQTTSNPSTSNTSLPVSRIEQDVALRAPKGDGRGGRKGGSRGRGRGRGRGRPAKPKRDDDEIEKEWEIEASMYSTYDKSVPGGTPTRHGKAGRRPKTCEGKTLADPERILELLDKVWERDAHDLFKKPVTEEEAPGYFQVIADPMDLGTIRRKNEEGLYQFWEQLATDLYRMFNNALKYNKNGSDCWKMAKAQQMHARSLIENARQGKQLVSAKARAATAARKVTMAAKVHAREKRNAVLKKARQEQKAAQEAKILKKAGVGVNDEYNDRTTFRRAPEASNHYQYKGLAGAKSGDNVYIGLYGASFDRDNPPSVPEYGNSLHRFVSTLSFAAYNRVKLVVGNMAPRHWNM